MKNLGDIIKIIAEKHLIALITSMVIAAVIYLLAPNFWGISGKISDVGYWLLIAGIVFLIIQLIIWCRDRLYTYKKMGTENDIRTKKYVERVRSIVDGFIQEDREYILEFVKNQNKPIIIRETIWYPYERLFSSSYVNSQKCYDEKGEYTQYVLVDDFYQILKYSYEIDGKISHF